MKFVQRCRKQRKNDHRLKKMEEKEIVYRIAGEGVQYAADDSIAAIPHISSEINVSCQRGKAELEDQQGTEAVGDPGGGQQRRQPEERRTQKIKAVAADKVGAQVGQMAPSEVSRADGIVCQFIKRDLLHIEVAVIQKIPAAGDHNRDYDRRRQKRSPQKGVKGIGTVLVWHPMQSQFQPSR